MGSGTDSTYGNQLNYREQGGNRDVIGGEIDVVSAGHIDIESGGDINVASGGEITIASGATLTVAGTQTITGTVSISTGGKIAVSVTAGTTGTMLNYGHTTVASTGNRRTFTIAAPAAGVMKSIICTAANSTGECVIDLGSGKTAAGKRYLQMDAANEAVVLIGRSTTVWDIISNVGSVQSTTSTT